jgi:ABC-type Mn2+/Zn2+ transport system permease subunit
MIAAFIDSWELFHNAYISALLVSALLGLVGVVVVARDQIFIGAAISQASMLGIATGIRVEEAFGIEVATSRFGNLLHSLLGGVVAVAGALATALDSGGRESREAITGWVFLVGASLSVLVVAHSPHGLAEVEHLLASTIIGAGIADVWLLAALLVCSISVAVIHRDALLLAILDPEMARACGVRTAAWDRALAVWLGVVVATSIHVAGVLFAFGALVLPALAAKNLCREVRAMLVVSPLLAVTFTLVGLVLANAKDYPPGQMAVALYAAMLAVAWIWRARSRLTKSRS